MNSVLQNMLNKYEIKNTIDETNAMKEIIQEIVICGLSRGGFFDVAAFYGGTALRIFYGLDRFSEDLDFSLKETDFDFKLEKYFPNNPDLEKIKEKFVYYFAIKSPVQNRI